MAAIPARKKQQKQAPPLEESSIVEMDRVIHERTRLAIVSALAVNESLSFRALKDLLDTSDGNLSVHARKLEEAGYLTCSKGFEGRTPRTDYAITKKGRETLEAYLAHMERLIHHVRGKR